MKRLFLALIILNSQSVFGYQQDILNNMNPIEFKHENRFSLMYGVAPSLRSATEVGNFTISYSKKSENFWWDANLLIANGLFSRFGKNNPAATGLTDTQLADQRNGHTTVGIGVGRETRYAQTLLPFSDIYEMMSANITYNIYKENLSGKSFSGPGILAKMTMYKMINEYFSVGTHFNYNLSVVKKAQDFDTETSSARSLTLGYLTVGFDVSLFL